MHTQRIKAALKYEFLTSAKGLIAFYAIMLAVLIFISVISFNVAFNGEENRIVFNGLDMATAIMAFVMGISVIRENLKMLLQNGCGRRTVFYTEVLNAAIVCLLLSLCNQILILIFNAVSPQAYNITLFSAIYEGNNAFNHFSHMLLSFIVLLALWQSGNLISLAYYRMEKTAKLIVSIAVPTALLFGLPALSLRIPALTRTAGAAMAFLLRTPYHMALCFLAVLAVVVAVNWLLLRKAQVRE